MHTVRVIAVMGWVFAAACSGVRPQPDATATASSSSAERPRTTLEVTNRHAVEVDIFALDRTQRVYMGSVPARRTRTLTIPAHLIAEGGGRLRFQAKAPGSGNLLAREEEFLVREGEALSLTLR
jgi:hypothetical protein